MAPPPVRPPPQAKKRMSVAAVTKGIRVQGRRFAFYGPEGVGKTTFASGADRPVFFDLEIGSDWFPNIPRMPGRDELGRDVTFNDVIDGVESLIYDDHDYRTAVFDTADKLEAMIFQHINANKVDKHGNRMESIEDWGYGKGYQFALDKWRDFVERYIEDLRVKRGMDIVFLGHSIVKTFKNPAGDDFDRYQMRLQDKAASFIKEYCDVVGFMQFETVVKCDDKKRSRGSDTGARILHLKREAAWDAKTRFPAPKHLPLQWADFIQAMENGKTGDAPSMLRRLDQLLEDIDNDEQRDKLANRIKDCGEDTVRLSKAIDYVNGLLFNQAERG